MKRGSDTSPIAFALRQTWLSTFIAIAFSVPHPAFAANEDLSKIAPAAYVDIAGTRNCQSYSWNERENAPPKVREMLNDVFEGFEAIYCINQAGDKIYSVVGPIEFADGVSYYLFYTSMEPNASETLTGGVSRESIELPRSIYMATNPDAREIERSDPRFIETYFLTIGTFKMIESTWRTVLNSRADNATLSGHKSLSASLKHCSTEVLQMVKTSGALRIIGISFAEPYGLEPPSYRIEFRTENRIFGFNFDLAPNSTITTRCE